MIEPTVHGVPFAASRHLTLWPPQSRCAQISNLREPERSGTRRVVAPSRPDSGCGSRRGEDYFPPSVKRPACSGAGMWKRGAASLADVPYWRKP